MISLAAPSLSSLSTEEGRRQLQDYLYRLTQELRFYLSNVSEENLSEELSKTVQTASATASAAQSLAKATEAGLGTARSELGEANAAILSNYEELYAAIVRTAAEVTSDFETALGTTVSTVYSSVSEGYTAKSETALLTENFSSFVTQTSSDITTIFARSGRIESALGEVEELTSSLSSYIRTDANGIELGKFDSPFVARISNTKLSFLQNGVEIAYVSNNTLYITDATVTRKLTLGCEATGVFFDLTVDSDGLAVTNRTG